MIPAIARSVVVLPAPFGPTSPSTSPGRTANERSCTAVNAPKILDSPVTSITFESPAWIVTRGYSTASRLQVYQAALVRDRDGFGAAHRVELRENCFDVRLGRAFGDREAPRDVLVAAPLREQLQHVGLALRERRLAHALQCFDRDGRRRVLASLADRADRRQNLLPS